MTKTIFSLLLLFVFFFSCSTPRQTTETKPTTTLEEIKEVIEDLEVTTKEPPTPPKDEYIFSFYKDYDKLLQETLYSKNEVYIDSLLAKFHAKEILNKKQRVGLIIGSTNLPGYLDERLETMYTEIDQILLKIDTKKPEDRAKDINKVIELSDSCLAIFPLSIEGIIGNYYGYSLKGDSKTEKEYFSLGNIIFRSMLDTGTRNTKDQPYIGLGKAGVHWYCMGYAQAGYKKVEEAKDDSENTIQGYKNVLGEIDYYLIPKKKIKN